MGAVGGALVLHREGPKAYLMRDVPRRCEKSGDEVGAEEDEQQPRWSGRRSRGRTG